MHFGENQLAPSSISISPLTTIHPVIFQHQSVRSSTQYHLSFNLTMVRSSGFGSITSDICPIQARFHYGFSILCLNLPLPISRRLILQQAHGHPISRAPIACKLTVSCSISLPSRGSFHLSLAVLFRYRSHSSTQPYEVVLADSHGISRVPCYSGQNFKSFSFQLLDFHHLWCRIQLLRLRIDLFFDIFPRPRTLFVFSLAFFSPRANQAQRILGL